MPYAPSAGVGGAAGAGADHKVTTALVTRPREDSEGVARELAARGLDVVIEPLLDIVPVEACVDAAGIQGILATSANGVRALARVLADRTIPVWAVGDASARVARELGYTQVESAGGDVDTLAALVMDRCKPEDGAFLHAAGTVTAGDLSGRLEGAGFTVRRVVLYEAKTATELSASLTDVLSRQGVQVALFFSPRTAATFATLVRSAGLDHATGRMTALALSPAVAAALAALPWAEIRVAATPTQAALLALLDHSRMTMTEPDQPKPDAPETPAAEAETAPENVTAEDKSTPWGAIAAALAVVALVGGGLATWPEWKHLVSESHPVATPVQAPQADELESLRTDLAATREQLRRVEERLNQPVPGAAPALTPLENRLTQNEAAIRALQAQPQVPAKLVDEVDSLSKQVAELQKTSADAAAVLRLADRVEKVEAGFRDMQARRSSASAMMLAVGQLREALSKAMPYDSELRAVRALGGQDAEVVPALDALKPRAITGIPTQPVLTARFEALAPAIVRAAVLPEKQSWWRQTMDRFTSLVVVRREDGNAAGTQPAAIVARAEAALNQGDLAGAVGEVETLSGGPADQAANWLTDAKARLAADKAVSELTAHVIASIGAGQ